MLFCIRFRFVILALFLLATNNLKAQTTVYASGLQRPLGFELDGRGWLWVCEQGTRNNDGRISIVTVDGQVHPFLTGLPSEQSTVTFETVGPTHCYFDIDGKLLVLIGDGTDTLSQSILVVDTTGFVPGDAPLTRDNIESAYLIDDQGFGQSNPYTMALGPNNDYYIVDAAGNAIVKRERSAGTNSVFANFPNIPNPSSQGPSTINTVPTSILFDQANSKFYVSSLTGFPFPNGSAKIYQVDLSGNISDFKSDLTTIVEIQIDPQDGKIAALKHGIWVGSNFSANSGVVIKVINNKSVDTLVSGLNFPTGMRFDGNGSLFISEINDGEIVKANLLTDINDKKSSPELFSLYQNYPNPFNPSTVISWQLAVGSHVTLKVYDVLGNEVATLVNENKSAGNYQVEFSAKGGSASGGDAYDLASGVYFYRLEAGNFVETKKLILLR